MRSFAEENAVVIELLYRHGRREIEMQRLPDGPADLVLDDGSASVIACRLDRGPLILPDNERGGCADCFAPIQFRPVPLAPGRVRLCLFCFLKRLG